MICRPASSCSIRRLTPDSHRRKSSFHALFSNVAEKNTQVRSSRRFAQNFPAWWSWTLRACRCLPPLFGLFPTHWLSCKTHNCFWMNVQDSVQNAPAIKTPWIGLSLSAPRRFMLYAVYICICICICVCIYIYTHMNLKCRSVDLYNIYTLVLALLAKEINRKHNFHQFSR